MHRSLSEIRNETVEKDPVSLDKPEWNEKLINDANWISENFGIAELAEDTASAVKPAQTRSPSPNFKELDQLSNFFNKPMDCQSNPKYDQQDS